MVFEDASRRYILLPFFLKHFVVVCPASVRKRFFFVFCAKKGGRKGARRCTLHTHMSTYLSYGSCVLKTKWSPALIPSRRSSHRTVFQYARAIRKIAHHTLTSFQLIFQWILLFNSHDIAYLWTSIDVVNAFAIDRWPCILVEDLSRISNGRFSHWCKSCVRPNSLRRPIRHF